MLTDFPGTYSLAPISGEERIARWSRLRWRAPLEAGAVRGGRHPLGESLALALQAPARVPGKARTLVVATMVDAFPPGSGAFDGAGLSEALGFPFTPSRGKPASA